jgi:formylglycine-generating enzyme required for sulfatase activity
MRGKIFINYRRDDAIATAGRLHDRLSRAFGRRNLFMDVDHIPPGVDFVGFLNRQIANSDLVLVVIGPGWLHARNEKGERRLNNPADFVSVEIAAALTRNTLVIPVLVDGAKMPDADELPEPLKPLVRRNAIEIRNSQFGGDSERLVQKVREALRTGRRATRQRWWIASVATVLIVSGGGVLLHQSDISLPWPAPSSQIKEVPKANAGSETGEKRANEVPTEATAEVEAARGEVVARRRAEDEARARAAAEAAKRKSEEAERQHLAALRVEEDRQRAEDEEVARKRAEDEARTRAAAEAAKRKSEEAERQRLAALRVEEERQRAEAKQKADAEITRKRAEGEARKRAEAMRKQSEAEELKPGRAFRDCPEVCPEMIVVPAGAFLMGSEDGEEIEGPAHHVTIAMPFAVGRFEVTFAEWDACVSEGGCQHTPSDAGWGRERRPVIDVSSDHVTTQYLPWLAKKTGKPYRLLSEAEWEYAARAGTRTAFSWGDALGRNRANCDGCGSQWDKRRTAPVGSFPANSFGLHDMHGNVYELTGDCWNSNYQAAPVDGSAWTKGDCKRRTIRGGSWFTTLKYLRSSHRDSDSTRYKNSNVGFRVARAL